MENLIIELSKYIIIIIITLYTLYSFTVFRNNNKKRQNRIFLKQRVIIFIIHFITQFILYLHTKSLKIIIIYLAEVFFFLLVICIYQSVYKNLSKLVLNHMLLLLMISFSVLARLIYYEAIKQLIFSFVVFSACLIVPYFIEKFEYLENLGWIYGIVGTLLLLIVLGFGKEVYGAKNWIQIKSFMIQPSEFVKILFVLFSAALLAKAENFIDIVKITILAAIHVLILVLENDLGGALIYFLTYLILVYIATTNLLYFLAGILSGSGAAMVAYRMFGHVRVRVMAWKDPWSIIDNQGYQIAQSLFAIGTGGWFGMGFCKGLPSTIPVKDSDFIFAVISEEFGGIFAVCLVLICLSCFIMFVNIAMKMKKKFYKLVAFGFSIMYIFQVFLNIGGVTKFIPSTGVTLPLVSYGGSSLVSTVIMFSIIQGLYVLNQDEDDKIGQNKRNDRQNNLSKKEKY